jgi:NitT/TauT family transport system substrate-binding protein
MIKETFFKKYIVIIPVLIISVVLLLSGCSYGIDFDNLEQNTATNDIEASTSTESFNNTGESSSNGTAAEKIENIKVNIGSLKGPTSIGMIKMHEEKPQLSDKITANYIIVPNPELMVSKLLSGEIDIATLPTNVAAKLYNKGLDYRLAAVTGYGVLYILDNTGKLKDWSSLKGKKINVISKGSTPDVALRFLLNKNNIDAGNDVVLDYTLEQVELSQMMIANKAEIAILPEPFVTMVLSKNSQVKIALDIEKEWKKVQNGNPMPMSCIVVKSALIDNNKEEIGNFLNLYRESIEWVNSNIEQAALLVEKKEIGMDAKTAQSAIPRCNIKFTEISLAQGIVQDYLNTILDFSPEDVGGKIPDENFYY